MNDQKLLLGELKEFRRHALKELSDIRRDVRALMAFKWKVIGFASITSFLASIVIEFLRH